MAGKTKTIKLGLRLSHLYYITNNMNSKIIENVKRNIKNGLELFDKMAIERGIEIWKPIDGYDNYEVSSLGNVRNLKTGRVLKQFILNSGYKYVDLYLKCSRKRFLVHRLVGITFLDKIEGRNNVDHVDNNISNNTIPNLRFCNQTENARNSKLSVKNTSGVRGVCFDKKKRKWLSSICINGKHKHIGYYDNLEEAKKARQDKAFEIFGEYINSCEL